MYSSALALTPTLDEVDGQRHAPAALLPPPRARPGTHCWVGPRDGLITYRKQGKVLLVNPALSRISATYGSVLTSNQRNL
jgi:hypothetical protein